MLRKLQNATDMMGEYVLEILVWLQGIVCVGGPLCLIVYGIVRVVKSI